MNALQDLDLIERIYGCALRPDLWPRTLGELCVRLACDAGVLYLGCRSGLTQVKAVALPCSAFSGRLIDAIVNRELVVAGEQLEATMDMIGTGSLSSDTSAYIALSLFTDEHTTTFLVLARQISHASSANFDRNTLATIAPHLRRAAQISNKLIGQALVHTTLEQSLDALSVGVLHVKSDLSVVHANQAGHQMINSGGPLRFCNGILRAKNKQASIALRDAVRSPTAAASAPTSSGFIRLDNDDGDAPIVAYVKVLTVPAGHSTLPSEPVASIFIAQPQRKSTAWTHSFASAFRLTRAEQRVLDLILDGETLAGTAARLGIAISTARTHLRKIFEKSGVSRQPELVKLAATIAPTVAVTSRAT